MKTKIKEQFQKTLHKRLTKHISKHQTFKIQKLLQKVGDHIQATAGLIESLLLVGFSIFIFGQNTFKTLPEATSFSYPLQMISTIECRTLRREEMPASCKIPFPEIKTLNLEGYASNKLYQDSYSVLRGAPYSSGWAVTAGSHPGIDLPTAKGTPIYATAQGEVIFAGWTNGYGNNIRIKHRYQGGFIYSIYAHLETISVKQGDIVTSQQRIGEVGNSGTSKGDLGGNHLHFEITQDNGGRAKYAFLGCKDLALGDTAIIQQGLCRKEMESYTIDPIKLIISTTPKALASTTKPEPIKTPTVTHSSAPILSENNNEKVTVSGNFSKNLADVGKETSITRFFSQYTIKTHLSFSKEQKKGTLSISLIHRDDGTAFKGILPAPITLISNKKEIILDNQTIQRLDSESVTIPVTIKNTSSGIISFMIQDRNRGTLSYTNKK